jgi:VanZ family protein
MRQLRYLKVWLILGWTLVGLVIFFSLTPRPPDVLGFQGGDKLQHLFAYTVIMLWFGLIYFPGRAYRNLGIIVFTIGVTLEIIQGITGLRSLSLLDMLANGLGVFLGWLLAKTRLSSALIQVESFLDSINA